MATEFTYTLEDATVRRSDVSAAEWVLLLKNSHDPEGYADAESLTLDVELNCTADLEDDYITWDCESLTLDDGTVIDGGAIYRAIKFPEAYLEERAEEVLRIIWMPNSYTGDYTAGGKWVEA